MHKISDWLALHSLNAQQTARCLTLMTLQHLHKRGLGQEIREGTPKILSCSDALSDVTAALKDYFQEFTVPSLDEDRITWISDAAKLPENAPVTVQNADTDQIFVFCSYEDTSSDLMALAHEFGHALQLVQSDKAFIPPVDREIAAFLAEHILLEYLRSTDSVLYAGMQSVWETETEVYLGPDALTLLAALDHLDTPYEYRQNYPLARIAAALLFASGDKKQVWRAFNGLVAVTELLETPNPTESLVA